MRCVLLYFALFPPVMSINQPHNSRTHRGLRSNVYLPSTIRLSDPHIVKEKYCALLRANGSSTVIKIPVNMTLGKIFHYVLIEIFDTFYRTGRTGSLSIQKLSRNASSWSRLRFVLVAFFVIVQTHSLSPPMYSLHSLIYSHSIRSLFLN